MTCPSPRPGSRRWRLDRLLDALGGQLPAPGVVDPNTLARLLNCTSGQVLRDLRDLRDQHDNVG